MDHEPEQVELPDCYECDPLAYRQKYSGMNVAPGAYVMLCLWHASKRAPIIPPDLLPGSERSWKRGIWQ